MKTGYFWKRVHDNNQSANSMMESGLKHEPETRALQLNALTQEKQPALLPLRHVPSDMGCCPKIVTKKADDERILSVKLAQITLSMMNWANRFVQKQRKAIWQGRMTSACWWHLNQRLLLFRVWLHHGTTWSDTTCTICSRAEGTGGAAEVSRDRILGESWNHQRLLINHKRSYHFHLPLHSRLEREHLLLQSVHSCWRSWTAWPTNMWLQEKTQMALPSGTEAEKGAWTGPPTVVASGQGIWTLDPQEVMHPTPVQPYGLPDLISKGE